MSPDGLIVRRTVGMTDRDWAIVQKEADEGGDSLSAALRRIVSAWEAATARRAVLAREMADLDEMWARGEREDRER